MNNKLDEPEHEGHPLVRCTRVIKGEKHLIHLPIIWCLPCNKIITENSIA